MSVYKSVIFVNNKLTHLHCVVLPEAKHLNGFFTYCPVNKPLNYELISLYKQILSFEKLLNKIIKMLISTDND